MKTLIEQFNRQDTTLVISDYPEYSQKGEKNHGIAWYTKEFIEPIAKNYKARFVVLAQKGIDNEPKFYKNKHILILRVFDHGHVVLFPRILKWLLKFNYIENVHVHSEFYANGSFKNEALLIPFLLLIKLVKRNITYFSHNVITDISPFTSHIGIPKNPLFIRILNFFLPYYYKFLGSVVDRFVVMDKVVYKRLSTFIDPKKIIYSPFWIRERKFSLGKSRARAKLGIAQKDFVLLCFGFVSRYKGSDWIIDAVKKLRKKPTFTNIRLILAGGKSFSLQNKKQYQLYYKNLEEKIREEANIEITGFVTEKKIPLYFKAADIAVLPYRGLMGGSASLIQAISFHKPFIISNKMKDVVNANGINPSSFVFAHNLESFTSVLTKVRNEKTRKKLEKFSRQLAKNYHIKKLLPEAYSKLFVQNKYSISILKRPMPQFMYKT